jgi:hypothetical protein
MVREMYLLLLAAGMQHTPVQARTPYRQPPFLRKSRSPDMIYTVVLTPEYDRSSQFDLRT